MFLTDEQLTQMRELLTSVKTTQKTPHIVLLNHVVGLEDVGQPFSPLMKAIDRELVRPMFEDNSLRLTLTEAGEEFLQTYKTL